MPIDQPQPTSSLRANAGGRWHLDRSALCTSLFCSFAGGAHSGCVREVRRRFRKRGLLEWRRRLASVSRPQPSGGTPLPLFVFLFLLRVRLRWGRVFLRRRL